MAFFIASLILNPGGGTSRGASGIAVLGAAALGAAEGTLSTAAMPTHVKSERVRLLFLSLLLAPGNASVNKRVAGSEVDAAALFTHKRTERLGAI